MSRDPIQKVEEIVKDAHDRVGKRTLPVLKHYPLIFSFLIVFSVAAILHGFELWADQIAFFEEYPSSLILFGIFMLFVTGMLYKSLEKM